MPSGSIRQLDDGRYLVRWRTPDGRQPSRRFQNKKVAERFLRNTLTDQEREGVGFISNRDTVRDAADRWWKAKKRGVKPRTAEKYELNRTIIIDRLGDLKLAEVTYDVVQDFINALSDEYAPRTVRGIYGVLALILQDAAKRGQVRAMGKPEMPRVAKPRITVPTAEQVERLADKIDVRLYAAVILAGYCGLREGEILALHRTDIDLDRRRIVVHQAVNKSTGELESTKTEHVRRVHLPRRVVAALDGHLAEFPGERLFPMRGRALQHSWERARTEAGLPSVRFHDLRHCAASVMIAAGWNIRLVATQLGHADPTMTLRTYAHLWPDSFDEALDRLDAYIEH